MFLGAFRFFWFEALVAKSNVNITHQNSDDRTILKKKAQVSIEEFFCLKKAPSSTTTNPKISECIS